MNIEQARFNMIEQQIRPWNVLDPAVLSLQSAVKREDFVPAAHRTLAFMDIEVPLADGQVMLAPRVEARLLQELALHRHEKVLESGTGSGFMAALLAHKSQQVLSYEIRPTLSAMARENLRHAMVMNAEVRQGHGSAGDTARGPWDAIVLSGSVAQVPHTLLDQLKVGGRLVAIVIGTSSLTVHGVERLGGGEFTFAEDFHEIVTFLALGAITGGAVEVKNSTPEQFPLLDRTFGKFGVEIRHEGGWSRHVNHGALRVKEPFTRNILQKVQAAPWPYLPVDLLPIFVTPGVKAEGPCMFWNKVYDGAMGWTSELSKFGAHTFFADPHRIITFGGKPLQPASVESPYSIRAAIAMLMLACAIPCRTTSSIPGIPSQAPTGSPTA